MKRLATLVLITGLLAGCNTPLFTAGKPVLPGTNQPVEALAGVTFKPISATNARLIGSSAGGNVIASGGGNAVRTDGAMAAAPTAAAAPAAVAGGAPAMDTAIVANNGSIGKAAVAGPIAQNNAEGGAYSGNVWGYYSYSNDFGPYGNGGSDPMALVSITQAETAGSKGTFGDVVKNVAAPVVKAWAPDGRLIQSSATLGGDGQAYADPNQASTRQPTVVDGFDYYGQTPGWRLAYLSSSRNEMLTFYVTPQKTLIIRMRWAPLSLAPELVTVDSATAIKKLTAAIEDKTFKGEEEKSGLDYFLGTPFDQPKTPPTNEYSKTEVVYDVPDKARWNVSLESVLGKLVWRLDYNTYDQGIAYPVGVVDSGVAVATGVAVAAPAVVKAGFSVQQVASMPAVMPKPLPPVPAPSAQPGGQWREGYFSNYGSGMIDAQTGAVIRFSRPTKYYYRDYSYPMPTPMPVPVDPPVKGSPAPDPVETTTPGTTVGSTGSVDPPPTKQ